MAGLTIETPYQEKHPEPEMIYNSGQRMPVPEKVQKFFDELQDLCRKHDMDITHEDHQGCFILTPYEEGPVLHVNNTYLELPDLL